jgi:hypothetical protein
VVLGLYYTTRGHINAKGEAWSSPTSVKSSARLDASVVELTAKIAVRITEYTKDKETGEFTPSTSAGGHDRGPCAAVRDPAEGPAVLEHQQGVEEEGNLQAHRSRSASAA